MPHKWDFIWCEGYYIATIKFVSGTWPSVIIKIKYQILSKLDKSISQNNNYEATNATNAWYHLTLQLKLNFI